ncbi:hypothetical protein P154DRAFT_574552 [Amniculicola lignicola CBS 123094]|uniref:Uncharacterized protein n=1 Tax=Amniculicola lignicola CBS 123094 TaxID=1392246 RepID=A0A6A5WS31_9PLEO|nr:hypothetical protein P154DRAFT_574552 [Amniculicola lignicola CBS 123094]
MGSPISPSRGTPLTHMPIPLQLKFCAASLWAVLMRHALLHTTAQALTNPKATENINGFLHILHAYVIFTRKGYWRIYYLALSFAALYLGALIPPILGQVPYSWELMVHFCLAFSLITELEWWIQLRGQVLHPLCISCSTNSIPSRMPHPSPADITGTLIHIGLRATERGIYCMLGLTTIHGLLHGAEHVGIYFQSAFFGSDWQFYLLLFLSSRVLERGAVWAYDVLHPVVLWFLDISFPWITSFGKTLLLFRPRNVRKTKVYVLEIKWLIGVGHFLEDLFLSC